MNYLQILFVLDRVLKRLVYKEKAPMFGLRCCNAIQFSLFQTRVKAGQ